VAAIQKVRELLPLTREILLNVNVALPPLSLQPLMVPSVRVVPLLVDTKSLGVLPPELLVVVVALTVWLWVLVVRSLLLDPVSLLNETAVTAVTLSCSTVTDCPRIVRTVLSSCVAIWLS
jgi:hypothetical protein